MKLRAMEQLTPEILFLFGQAVHHFGQHILVKSVVVCIGKMASRYSIGRTIVPFSKVALLSIATMTMSKRAGFDCPG